MKVAFRANGGGAGIGFGHLMRCIAIADALKERGAVPWFVSKNYPAGIQLVKDRGYAVHVLPHNASLEDDLRMSLLLTKDADVIVADSYEFDTHYLSGLRASGKFVAAFDDKMDRDLPVDAVIGNAYATREGYGSKLPADTVLLAGPKYIPLRKQFQGLPQHPLKTDLKRVLITMGGEDPVNATLQAVTALTDYPKKLQLDVLIGSAYPYKESLERALAQSPHKTTLHRQVADVLTHYTKADTAITAPGVSLWEMAAAGVPMVIVQTADNQNGVVQYAKKNYLGIVLGWYNKLSPNAYLNGLAAFDDNLERRDYSLRCQTFVDGKGAGRIAEALQNAYAQRKQ